MLLRLPAFSIATRFQHRRLFQSSAVRREGSRNHYETLQIPVNATPADVKKSFYALSKTHHPDRNPNDPDASSRFVKISEAYTILGTPAKRQAYDRSILPPQSSSSHHPHNRQGSYHSSSPAGGRPASGLSRRRTQFRGPPPSFYRSGGWGTHSAKRAAAQGNGAPGAQEPDYGENINPNMSGGGMGPGQMGWGHGNDVPHFDKEGHFRTHEGYEKRRRERMSGGAMEGERPRGMLGQFFFVGGIIFVGVLVPSLVFERLARGTPGRKEDR